MDEVFIPGAQVLMDRMDGGIAELVEAQATLTPRRRI